MVVLMLPGAEGVGCRRQTVEARPTPKLFFVDPMTPFHFPVLFRASRGNVAEADASLLHRQGKGKREFCAIINLNFANGKREHLPNRGQKLKTGAMILAGIEAQDAIPRAVIEGRILKTFLPRHFHFFNINLHTITWLVLTEEQRLSRASRAGAPDWRMAEIPADPADCCGRDADAMHPIQPEPGPHRPKLQLAAGLLNESDGLLGQPSAALHRMARHQSDGPTGYPAPVPGSHRFTIQAEAPGGAFEPIFVRVAQNRQSAVDEVMMSGGDAQCSQVLRRDQSHGIPLGDSS